MSTHCARCRRQIRQSGRPDERRVKVRIGMEAVDRGVPVMQAGLQAGYRDPFSFSRACAEVFGQPPTKLRGTDWRERLVAA
jgi:methylphosphotriester-DNA--protein-cysteine methyltransferase